MTFSLLISSYAILPTAPMVEARVITYTGIGEYPMGEGETVEMARERAKERAERNAMEQAGVQVESETKIINHVVEHDEIMTITRGILKIIGQPVYEPVVDGNGFMIRATIKEDIETDDVAEWLKLSFCTVPVRQR